MASKVKQIKTMNEYNHLTSPATVGNKAIVIIFFDGSNAAAWKSHLGQLNDLAGDLFDEASLIAVDTRFFPDVLKAHKATRAGQAAVYRGDSQPILYEDNDAASIKATVHKLLGKK